MPRATRSACVCHLALSSVVLPMIAANALRPTCKEYKNVRPSLVLVGPWLFIPTEELSFDWVGSCNAHNQWENRRGKADRSTQNTKIEQATSYTLQDDTLGNIFGFLSHDPRIFMLFSVDLWSLEQDYGGTDLLHWHLFLLFCLRATWMSWWRSLQTWVPCALGKTTGDEMQHCAIALMWRSLVATPRFFVKNKRWTTSL